MRFSLYQAHNPLFVPRASTVTSSKLWIENSSRRSINVTVLCSVRQITEIGPLVASRSSSLTCRVPGMAGACKEDAVVVFYTVLVARRPPPPFPLRQSVARTTQIATSSSHDQLPISFWCYPCLKVNEWLIHFSENVFSSFDFITTYIII